MTHCHVLLIEYRKDLADRGRQPFGGHHRVLHREDRRLHNDRPELTARTGYACLAIDAEMDSMIESSRGTEHGPPKAVGLN
jgi:hypothetical protein